MPNRDVIVVGGSAGAVAGFKEVLQALPRALPASVFVVLHVDPAFGHIIAPNIARTSPLPVEVVDTQRTISIGRVYFPIPDHHLVVGEGHVRVTRGPHENLWRPAIDVLFRSAAVAYGSRVIGVLLSGNLDDGTAGMAAVKTCGGVAVIERPTDASYADMPETAALFVDAAERLPIADIAARLIELSQMPAPTAPIPPQDLIDEAAFAEPEYQREEPEQERKPSMFTCPECGGPLWEHTDSELRFRCLVGHSFRGESLLKAAAGTVERTLWAAVRMFEQRMHLARRMASQEASRGREVRARIYLERSEDSERHARRLREMLKGGQLNR